MPLVSSGGASQVKDTGHNGMESIGICLPVLTLSVFLVREIRTDNHLHPSPPPRAHSPESSPVTQDGTRLPASTNKTGPRGEERRRGARAQANTRDVAIRTRTKKLLYCGSSSLEISGIGTGAAEKMRCVSDARRQPTSRVRLSPTSIQRRLLLGGRGTAMRIGHHPRAGDLAGKEGGRPEGSRALPPLPSWGRAARRGNPAAPDLKGGWVREAANHPPRLGGPPS